MKKLSFLLSFILTISFILTAILFLNSRSFSQSGLDDSEKKKQGGTLIFARSADAIGLDPARQTNTESFYVTDNVYESLVTYEPGTSKIRPALAERWELSENGLEYTFYLRKGVRFHDNTEFNADAVLFSLNRQLKKDHPFHQYGPWHFWKAMAMDKIIKDVIKIDDYTVQIILNRKEAPVLANLAMHFASIVSPTTAKRYKADLKDIAIGTGPFKLVEWIKDEKMLFERFADYWGQKPYLDKLIFKVIPKATARYRALKRGEVDIIDSPSRNDVDKIKNNDNLKTVWSVALDVGYMALNMKKEPLNNKLVRQAINYAINKKAIIKAVYGKMGVPAKNPIPPNLWSYNADIKDYNYDPEKARELLAEAGYENGFELTLFAMPVERSYIPNGRKMAEMIQQQLKQVGINVKIVSYDWHTYLDKLYNLEHDMCLIGWIGDNGDPDNFFYALLSEESTKVPANNFAFWKNKQYNELIVKAKETTDTETRAELYRKAQEIIKEEAPWVPIAHSIVMMPMKKNIRGFKIYPTGNCKFQSVWIDKTIKPVDYRSKINTIKIGLNAPLTGDIPEVGRETKLAALMWAEKINRAGGIKLADESYKVEIIVEDNESYAETAVNANKKLINEDQVLAIVGPQSSKQAVPAGYIANQNATPMISPWSTNPKTTQNRPYVFRACFLDPAQGPALTNFVQEEFGFTKAAVLYDNASDYPKGQAESFKEAWEEKNGPSSVVAFESFQIRDKDFSAQLYKITQSDAEVLFVPQYYNEIHLIVKQARALGWKKPIIGSDSWASSETLKLCGKDCYGLFFSTHYTSYGNEGAAKKFVLDYKMKYGNRPEDPAALTWDSLNLIKTAIQNLGELSGNIKQDRQDLRDAMAEIKNFNGITGKIARFDENGNPEKCVVIVKIDNKGRFQFYQYACPDNATKSKKHLVVAVDATWPPMEFINDDREINGFDIDLMRAIAKEGGFTVEFKNTAWDGIFSGLEYDRYDAVMSSITITDKRKAKYDFSAPYINAGQVILVRSGTKRVNKLSKLRGKIVGAQIGTSGAMLIAQQKGLKLKTYDELSVAIEDLSKGRIKAVIADLPIAANFAYQKEEYRGKIKIAGGPFNTEFYGIVVKKGNGEVLRLFNKGLRRVKRKGILKKLIKKWFHVDYIP